MSDATQAQSLVRPMRRAGEHETVAYSTMITVDPCAEYSAKGRTWLEPDMAIRFCELRIGKASRGVWLTMSPETLRNLVRAGQQVLDDIAELDPPDMPVYMPERTP